MQSPPRCKLEPLRGEEGGGRALTRQESNRQKRESLPTQHPGLWLRRMIESVGLFIMEITLTVVEEELRKEGREDIARCCVFEVQ